jgi:casein kinase II subunit alpha
LPKMYQDAAIKHGESYFDYHKEVLKFKTGQDYEFIRKLGKGKYSEVFESVDLTTNRTVVCKLIKPIKEEKI